MKRKIFTTLLSPGFSRMPKKISKINKSFAHQEKNLCDQVIDKLLHDTDKDETKPSYYSHAKVGVSCNLLL